MSYIHAVNLAALDLNLLVALDALVTEAHVGRAARRIGLSQPAASNALRRLRQLLGDPLLVRVGARMELTPRAQSLRVPLGEALERVRGLFVTDGFDAATSARRFTLLMPDHVVDLVVPALERLGARAPRVRFDVAPWRGPATMTAELARAIDLVIGCTDETFAGFAREPLFADTEALAVRRGHPRRARLRRLDAFVAARHVAVIGRGQREDPVDTWLREEGVTRALAVVVPSYLQALHLVARTDLVAFVPRRLIEVERRALGLALVAPPLDPGRYQESLFFPTRAAADAGALWLRDQVRAIGRRLNRESVIAADSIKRSNRARA